MPANGLTKRPRQSPPRKTGRSCSRPRKQSDNACPKGVATVLRFSGIYGPGRLLRRIESVRSGEPIAANPDGFLNLIHVDDGATIVSRLAEREALQPTYLITDDRPVRRREYYRLLAGLVGGGEPVFQFDASGGGTVGMNKRCSNARLKAELGDILRFPTIESGLAHAVGERPA